jgi:hypothetical protein
MNLRQSVRWTTLVLSLTCTATAATVETTSSGFPVDLSIQDVVFKPDAPDNVRVDADFEGATVGTPFPGVLQAFNFFTDPTVFNTGRYTVALGLRAAPQSAGSIILTGPDTFESIFTANLRASFAFLGPGSGNGSGDVLGEFGNLPGFENCVNAAVSTCNVTGVFTISGRYSSGPGGFELLDVDVATIPEPSALLLWASGFAALFALRRARK